MYTAKDLNNIPNSVKFFKYETAENSPDSNSGCGINVYYDGNFSLQIVGVYGMDSLYFRTKHANGFRKWIKIPT